MKYSHLVHMPGDVKKWLEQQLKVQSIDGNLPPKYFVNLFEEKQLYSSLDSNSSDLNKKKQSDFKNVTTTVKEISNGNANFFKNSLIRDSDVWTMNPNLGFSYKLGNDTKCTETVQPSHPNSVWTQGLLHDSASHLNKEKMDDFFSALFYDPVDAFGFEFAWNKSEEQKNDFNRNRINFYNKQNLIASECSERLDERNTEIEKLIAKFDTNVEDIWKSTSEEDNLRNIKYKTLFSQNFFPSPCLQYGSNLIWSFQQNESNRCNPKEPEEEKESAPYYKSSFSHWNKFSSPVLHGSYRGFDTMISAFNATISNLQKWSAMDGCTNTSITPLDPKKSIFVSEVVPKTEIKNMNRSEDLECNRSRIIHSRSSQEEDLLTSARTHFRPIRNEEMASSQTGVYADGTTFAISNDLDEVSFKRSESGMLYLEVDADTPRKYMEFKEKESAGNKLEWDSDASSSEEFIPKFRVRQSNEKSIQTDDIDDEQLRQSNNDTDCDSVSCKSEDDEFYFPGDDELAQNIANTVDEDPLIENNKVDTDCSYENIKMEVFNLSSYNVGNPKSCVCNGESDWNQNFMEHSSRKQEWSEIWNSRMGCESFQRNSDKLSTKDKFRFREELTKEGEQLLLDLSCIQQMYSNSDWFDDDSISASDLIESEAHDPDEINSGEFTSRNTECTEKGTCWSLLVAEESLKNGFGLSCLWKEEKFLSDAVVTEKNKWNEKIERPFHEGVSQRERKRRNSSSQKACNLYLEGQCRRPHCRFAHCDSAIPCPFFADASCMKGDSCSLSHSTRRPLSL